MRNRWNDGEARDLDEMGLLVYSSRLIGAEPDLVLWGGGNTSVKRRERDFKGADVRVLRVKGSGSDLRTIEPKHFSGIRLDDLAPLLAREDMTDDEMVAYLAHTLIEPGSARPSIETLLHGFVPHRFIHHTHADAILSITNLDIGRKAVEACYGKDIVLVPYRRPGFKLSRQVAEAIQGSPAARAVVLEWHGLITWGETAKESYAGTIEMVTRAEEFAADRARGKQVFGPRAMATPPASERRRLAVELAPAIRGEASREARVVLHFDDGEDVLDFLHARDGAALSQVGPATPDHMMNTKVLPLFAADLPLGDAAASRSRLRELLGRYADTYRGWVKRHQRPGDPVLDPYPRVILVPGVGMFTTGKDAQRARIVADIYHHTIHVMRGAAGIGKYTSLPDDDAYDIEYWPLELYKLTLTPPEKELSRRVAFVTGGARGIGAAIARRLAGAGAHVVVTDLDAGGAERVAEAIARKEGAGRAIARGLDVTDETAVADAFAEACVAYGGVDVVVSNAGIAHSSPIDTLSASDWRRSLEVNATGHFLVAREALRVMKRQGLGGSIVFNASKNVLAPGKDFAAYSAAKAAQTQLARVLAIEAGPEGIRVNLVNPDAVFQDSGLWSEEVRAQRAAAQGIRPDEVEEYYRRRNLLQASVLPDDVAEAVLFLASDRSAKTTGAILPVDGGIVGAFPR
jgi:rhamnulose-1-phosphate aldolase/alcohol dehydrogenase